MNIFGIGGAELVLIIVIMLVVAGPARMIRWAYTIGQYVGKFRILWEQMVDVLQDEVDAAGLDVKLPRDVPTRATIAKTANDLIKPYAEQLEKTADEIKNPLQETINETTGAVKEAHQAGEDALKEADEVIKQERKKPNFTRPEGAVRADQSPEPPAPSDNSGASDLGAWSTTTATPEQADEQSTGSNFGAWSQTTTGNQQPEGNA